MLWDFTQLSLESYHGWVFLEPTESFEWHRSISAFMFIIENCNFGLKRCMRRRIHLCCAWRVLRCWCSEEVAVWICTYWRHRFTNLYQKFMFLLWPNPLSLMIRWESKIIEVLHLVSYGNFVDRWFGTLFVRFASEPIFDFLGCRL